MAADCIQPRSAGLFTIRSFQIEGQAQLVAFFVKTCNALSANLGLDLSVVAAMFLGLSVRSPSRACPLHAIRPCVRSQQPFSTAQMIHYAFALLRPRYAHRPANMYC